MSRFKLFLTIFGPGIVVMLADTDAGSIITAAQSGAVWSYKLISLQIILIPILFITQELTVRLGLVTGKGFAELIREQYGKCCSWLIISTLCICCIGALITQFIGIAGVGYLFGIPDMLSLVVVIAFLMAIVMSGTYRSVEKCAIFLGLFELVFVLVAWLAHPSYQLIAQELMSFPIHNSSYLYLAAANIGAVIMPWMIFYQQSAIVDKKLTIADLKYSRLDTAIGAVVTQIIMIAVIIITAATIGKQNPGAPLESVKQISSALTPFLGESIGKSLFALGMIGASMVAAIVVSLTAVWALGEVTGYKHSLEHKPHEAPWFYSIYCIVLLLSAVLVMFHENLINLSIAIEVLNAVLLPIVLVFLYLLAIKVLPRPYRLSGFYAVLVGLILLMTAGFGVFAGVWGWLM